MKIIKRNGTEATFDVSKIVNAISAANKECGSPMSAETIKEAADFVEFKCARMGRAMNVEEIQDMVINQIMASGAFSVARAYTEYRYKRTLARRANNTDDKILSLIECANEEIKQENSNKNSVIASTQRDYMAGEVSKDLTRRILLPDDVVKAHDEAIIHFHDMDYFANHIYNCCLVNLEDMLQNGTVISGTKIEKPHSFHTACNITTQIVAQVASLQYGGQTISLAHLAPFVDISRHHIREQVINERKENNECVNDVVVENIVKRRLAEEIERGVQTLQYQIITLMTTNGWWKNLAVVKSREPRQRVSLQFTA